MDTFTEMGASNEVTTVKTNARSFTAISSSIVCDEKRREFFKKERLFYTKRNRKELTQSESEVCFETTATLENVGGTLPTHASFASQLFY